MKRILVLRVVVASFLFGAAIAQDAAPTPPPRERLQEILDTARNRAGFPGGVLALAREGEVIAVVSGKVDYDGTQPMTADARMLAGSTGKTFYAALALTLVAESKLDLDAKLATYLEGEPWLARLRGSDAMTVRMLMNHTSGLVRYELGRAFLERFRAEPYRKWSIADRLETLNHGARSFKPGDGFSYSDTNYIVLGAILEKLCEHDLETEIARRFVGPLELAGVVAAKSPRIPGLVQGHAGERDAFVPQDAVIGDDGALRFDPSFEWAGGGYATTAGDLARWCRALHGGDVLPRDQRDAMQQGVECNLGHNVRYGLGAIVWPTKHGTAYGHSGFFPGYVSEMRYYPDLDVAVAIQLNTSEFAHLPPLGPLLDAAAGLVE